MPATQAVLPRPMPSMVTHPALRRSYRPYRCHVGAMSRPARGIPPGTVKRGTPGVGERIRAARKAAGLTIAVLAERADVDKGSLTGWELEIRDMTVTQLVKVAAALDVPPGSLLPDAPLPAPVVLAASFACPGCGTECGVLMTTMSRPHRPNAIQDRNERPAPHERNAR